MKDIPGYEGLYAATENGEIWSLLTTKTRRRRVLKPFINTGGYLRVNLFKNGKMKHEYVHRLVALTFLANQKKDACVNHKDADPQNNRVNNLEWCSQKENIAFSRKLGNQAKDVPVLAFNILTGDCRKYPTLKEAGIDLFGVYYILRYHHQKQGSSFLYKQWKFEVQR